MRAQYKRWEARPDRMSFGPRLKLPFGTCSVRKTFTDREIEGAKFLMGEKLGTLMSEKVIGIKTEGREVDYEAGIVNSTLTLRLY